jgi:hypothetical protein
VSHTLETWRGVFGERDVLGAHQGALKLYAWLREQPGARAHETVMLHIGPKALRAARDATPYSPPWNRHGSSIVRAE